MLKIRKNDTAKDGTFAALSLVFEIGYVIAIPAVAFSFGGRFLDLHFGTSPLFLLLGIFISLGISSYLVWGKIRKL